MNLQGWLSYLERLHPEEIDLGLERIREVATRLNLSFSGPRVITVGGTNGKGSTVAMLNSILTCAGYKTGTYTSPHLLHYNERVCINQQPVSDAALCEAFAAVEAQRQDISLTYFEFGTLAALWLFARSELDFLILEVGLGGRLDAVNLVDADLSILSNVALDHMDWLGDNREQIGREKAGIFRPAKPALFGERDIPSSVLDYAQNIGAKLLVQGRDFAWQLADDGSHWHWQGSKASGLTVSYRDLPPIPFALDNAATVLEALSLLDEDLNRNTIEKGLKQAFLAGRLQRLKQDGREVILDVAHNPHAISNLIESVKRLFPSRPVALVIGMLKDKDIPGVLSLLRAVADHWYIGEIHQGRGGSAEMIYNQLQAEGVPCLQRFDSIESAYQAARRELGTEHVILVTGSFFTVSAVMALLEQEKSQAS